ncbi:hypothetical protein [Belnapia sp. F-4-1]|uniref:hypothetical protein n=1 Tax=Belnapia sp. F-4-1 TaxID=1545443 RepID=UPI0005BDB093|nr:hypothetical protein [Belnapia sp. F-4-1]
MPETPEPDPFTIPPPPAEPILSRRTPAPAPPEPPHPAAGPSRSGRSAEEEHALRHFALALALVFAPAAILLSLAILPGP